MKIKPVLCATLAAGMLLSSLVACTPREGDSDTDTETDTVTVTETVPETETEAGLMKNAVRVDYIQSTSSSLTAAAYTLYESLGEGVSFVSSAESEVPANAKGYVQFVEATADEVGNYGYAIERSDGAITVKATGLAGADGAVAHLLANAEVDGTSLIFTDGFLDANTAITEKREWDTDYTPKRGKYNAAYRDGTFYNDKNDSVSYVSNAMWHMFGLVDDGQNLVYRFGNEPTWFEWMSEKVAWSGDAAYIGEVKGKLRSFPQVSTGYMWSWGTYPYWQVGDCYSIHYDGTFRYIASVYDVISWEGSTDFLHEVDPDADGGSYSGLDASAGRTVLEKTEACMNYILEYLHGKDGYIQLTEESTYLNADGTERFDYVIEKNMYCWNNTGKDGSTASNYWDNLCFGNYDGYSNALFYNALQSMAGIYRMLGGDYIAKAEEMEALAVTVKEKFNEMYWSEDTGRYIACIDTDGRRVDLGLTFHNFEIMKYGLVDADRAASIFDWVDGDRIIAGESITGKDVFSYGKIIEKVNPAKGKKYQDKDFRLAAVTNTIAIESMGDNATKSAWWHGPDAIDVFSNASYGRHLENGGYIFYPVFYELMARTQFEGAQSTVDRLRQISEVYEYNLLKSDEGGWLEGLNGEFPESGLVPTTYLYSLIGASASYDGLHIAPAWGDAYEYMGVKKLTYGGKNYGVQVNRDGSCTIEATDGAVDMTLHYTPARFSTVDYTVTVWNADGTSAASTVTPDANGVIVAQLQAEGVTHITVTPVLP